MQSKFLRALIGENPCVDRRTITSFQYTFHGKDLEEKAVWLHPLPFVPDHFLFKKVNAETIKVACTKRCANKCGKTSENEKLFRCGGCKVTWYCGSECQKAHRKQHKDVCRKGFNGKIPDDIQSSIERLTAKWGLYLPMGREPYVGGFWILDLNDGHIPAYVLGIIQPDGSNPLEILSHKARNWFDSGANVFVWFSFPGDHSGGKSGIYFTCVFSSEKSVQTFDAEL